MYKTCLFIIILTVSACSHPPQKNTTPNDTHTKDHIALAISAADRTADDTIRDARSRPDVTLAMLDIGPGDVVFDVFGGAGYYSELIARVVGEDGKVFLHNNQAYLDFVKVPLEQRMNNIKLPQVIQHDREVSDMDIPTESIDAAMIIMSYHDLFYDDPQNSWPQIDHKSFIQQIHTGLKKGGKFMIVDHQANSGRQAMDSQSLHRIEKNYAIERIETLGFKLVAESAVLSNPNDDKNSSVFTPDNRGKTDRFIIVFEKQ